MDFKVVGTGRGITALQMDIKCDGLTREIMLEALEQARQGRVHVLREMLKVLRAPRDQLSPNAPRLESLTIPSEKIGLVIGPAGKNIREAPFINHTDQELMLIEALVGRSPPFVLPKSDYTGPRRNY